MMAIFFIGVNDLGNIIPCSEEESRDSSPINRGNVVIVDWSFVMGIAGKSIISFPKAWEARIDSATFRCFIDIVMISGMLIS